MTLRNLPILLLFSFVINMSFAQKNAGAVSYDAFVKDVTFSTNEKSRIKIVFWIPQLFWDVAAKTNKDLAPETVVQIKEALAEYAIFCVIDGDYSAPPTFKPFTDEQIRRSISLNYQGKTYKPVDEAALSEFAGNIKSAIEPMFASLLGSFGSGMKMYFFQVNDRNGDPMIDPSKEGSFTVLLSGTDITYNLPLPSLLENRICPTDEQSFQGNYKFCPFHGTPLK